MELNNIRIEGTGNMMTMKYALLPSDEIDDNVLERVKMNSPEGIIPVQVMDISGVRSFFSQFSGGTTLKSYMKMVLDKGAVLELLKNLIVCMDIGKLGIPVSYIAKKSDYIFVDPQTLNISCFVIPVKGEVNDPNEVRRFIRSVVSRLRFSENDKDNYVAKILTSLNSDRFSLNELNILISEMQLEVGEAQLGQMPMGDAKVDRMGVIRNRASAMPMNQPPFQSQPQFGGQPQFEQRPPFQGQPQLGGQPQFEQQPPFQSQPQFGGQPQFEQQPPFQGQPQFGGQPQFEQQPPFQGQPQFGGQPQFEQQPPFQSQPQFDGQPQFEPQPDLKFDPMTGQPMNSMEPPSPESILEEQSVSEPMVQEEIPAKAETQIEETVPEIPNNAPIDEGPAEDQVASNPENPEPIQEGMQEETPVNEEAPVQEESEVPEETESPQTEHQNPEIVPEPQMAGPTLEPQMTEPVSEPQAPMGMPGFEGPTPNMPGFGGPVPMNQPTFDGSAPTAPMFDGPTPAAPRNDIPSPNMPGFGAPIPPSMPGFEIPTQIDRTYEEPSQTDIPKFEVPSPEEISRFNDGVDNGSAQQQSVNRFDPMTGQPIGNDIPMGQPVNQFTPMGQPQMNPFAGQPQMNAPFGAQPQANAPFGMQPQMNNPFDGQTPMDNQNPFAGPVPPANTAAQDAMLPRPHFVREKTGEKIYIDKDEFKIGKSKLHADYAIENNTAISRIHVVIIKRNGVSYLKDNDSTNGTWIDGEKLEPGREVLLKANMKVKFGDEDFTFYLREGV